MMADLELLAQSMALSYRDALERRMEELRELPFGFRVTRPVLIQETKGDHVLVRYESTLVPDENVPPGTVVYE
jgi:hypothetical protein